MLEGLIPLLVLLLVLVVIFFIVKTAVAYFEGPAIVTQIFGLVLLLVFIVKALMIFGIKMP
jgi:hypothetical protein